MRRIITIVLLLMPVILIGQQIWPPEGMNMPGGYNGWSNPPTVNALAGIQKSGGTFLVDTMLSIRRYSTVINVQSTGGDITGGTHLWKFSSGPTSNYWANTWGGVTVAKDSLQSYTKEGANNSVTVTNGKYYTVNYEDAGYTNTRAIWMETSARPVTIKSLAQSPSSVSNFDSVRVQIITNGNKSAEEKFYVRYTANNWSSSSLILMSFTDTVGTAYIPVQSSSTTVKYYVFSTTKTTPTANYDLYTLNFINNSKANYSYTVTASQVILTAHGMNLPGSYDTWTNPPTKNALAGVQKAGGTFLLDTMLANRRYKTVINVQSTGGDVTGGVAGFKFTSGPTSDYWQNSWGGVMAIADSIQDYIYGHANNDSINLNNGYYYTVVFKDEGYSSTKAIWMKTSARPVNLNSISQSPISGSVTNGDSVRLSVNINTAKSAEEKIYVRYTTDNWGTSSLKLFSFTDTTGIAYIPNQSVGVTVKYYIFSTTKNLPVSDFDLYTINYLNNSKANYSYSVTQASTYSTQNGNWSNPNIWSTGSVPNSSLIYVTIKNSVTLDQNATVYKVTIDSSKTLIGNDGNQRVLTIAAGGQFINNGTFSANSGTVLFNGDGTISGNATTFSNVTLKGGVSFSGHTVNGTFSIDGGGYVNGTAPTYGLNSILKYNSGGTYGRYNEWTSNSGAGYPYSVQISGNTVFNLGANSGNVTKRNIAGNLVIDTGSVFAMDYGGSEMDSSLTVSGNVTINGTLALSSHSGGDLSLGGNLLNTGTFNINNRSVAFTGASNQTSTGVSDFPYLTLNKSGNLIINNNVTVSSHLNLNGGFLETGAFILQLGNNSVAGVTRTAGAVIGTCKSYIGTSTGSVVIPVGTTSYYRPLIFDISVAPSVAGYVTVTQQAESNAYTNISDLNDGGFTINRRSGIKWLITDTALAGGSFTLSVQAEGQIGITSATDLRVVRSTNNGSSFDLVGTHTAGSGVTGKRSGMTFSHLNGSTGSVFYLGGNSTVNSFGFMLNLTALIQGLYDNGLNKMISDTITVKLHSATSPYAVIESSQSVSDSTGFARLSFGNVNNNVPYYIVVHHRNALETWSKTSQQFVSGTLSYDFTNAANKAFGDNQIQKGSKWCIFNGDANQDDQVTLDDLLLVDSDNQNFTTGYTNTDINGDNQVTLDDLLITDANNQSFVSVQSPAVMTAKKSPMTEKEILILKKIKENKKSADGNRIAE